MRSVELTFCDSLSRVDNSGRSHEEELQCCRTLNLPSQAHLRKYLAPVMTKQDTQCS